LACQVFLVCLEWWLASAAWAGGGPENVLLVVNAKSARSLSVANYFVRLRQIPAGNVLTLSFDPAAEGTDIDTFRQQILLPVLKAINDRHLGPQIDYVVYSADFPTAIALDKDADKFLTAMRAEQDKGKPPGSDKPGSAKPASPPTWPQPLTKVGALNGLTYLWQAVIAVNAGYLDLRSNRYLRRDTPEQEKFPTLGFRSSYHFGPQGELLPSGGRNYLLSMMLGVTAGRGNSLEEVIHYLTRSAAADGTHPRGTIYFMQNSDIRSTVRHGMFPAAVKSLKALGVAAEIDEGILPLKKLDVQGAVIGTPFFDWKSCQSLILPGAICEHFTSFGGAMSSSAGQTPLSELLRNGAAAASGTVTEPYAVILKFPVPAIQVHYARGCTVAEAFYQSVSGPYQLLIVGDPLCRPWANIPKVSLSGVEPGATVQGTLTIKPAATLPGPGKIGHFELFIDQSRAAVCLPDGSLVFDTAQVGDGYHELRIVAVEASPIQSQGRQIVPISTANHGRTIKMETQAKGSVRPGKPLVITARSPGSREIVVVHHDRVVGTAVGDHGTLELDPAVLGLGPVWLQVVGRGGNGPAQDVWAAPIELTVEEGP
jgi:hypothetical protein